MRKRPGLGSGLNADDAQVGKPAGMSISNAGDPRRGTGICTNAVLKVDDATSNTCLSDPIGGSASFYDTRVDVVKA